MNLKALQGNLFGSTLFYCLNYSSIYKLIVSNPHFKSASENSYALLHPIGMYLILSIIIECNQPRIK